MLLAFRNANIFNEFSYHRITSSQVTIYGQDEM
jgi:hypothetical protein